MADRTTPPWLGREPAPAFVNRTFEGGNGYAHHPSLDVVGDGLAGLVKLLAGNDRRGRRFAERVGDSRVAIGLVETDDDPQDQRAHGRQPVIVRGVILSHEPAGWERALILDALAALPLPTAPGTYGGLAVPRPRLPDLPPVDHPWSARLTRYAGVGFAAVTMAADAGLTFGVGLGEPVGWVLRALVGAAVAGGWFVWSSVRPMTAVDLLAREWELVADRYEPAVNLAPVPVLVDDPDGRLRRTPAGWPEPAGGPTRFEAFWAGLGAARVTGVEPCRITDGSAVPVRFTRWYERVGGGWVLAAAGWQVPPADPVRLIEAGPG